ncbi:MAG: zinc metallopeptidase [Spirochaetes bacterium]|nr:MAG: zinc metallopeptidase [Spirochaetota bacterium]
MFGVDPLYWMLMAPVFAFSLWASFKVKSSFKKFSQVGSRSGMTGAQVAELILQRNGLGHVPVLETTGFLSDHYDPMKKVIKLSPEVFGSNSLASIGVAAHETGHAIQHAKGYKALMLRNTLAPTASIGSNFAWIIIFVGFMLGTLGLVKIGILLFSVVVVFQLITLPVEFNASSRAKEMLASYGILGASEMAGVSKVLSAAAMTYVAAAASAIVTLLYFLIRSGILGGRDD